MKGLLITGGITILILVAGVLFLSKGGSAPKPVTVDQSTLIREDSHQTNAGASVNIVEFGDYRCPACKAAFPGMLQILKDYGNKINFVFRNYAFLPDPGASSTNASTLAANAAECASDAGKFWEMHDWLYQNQPDESDIKIYNVDDLTKAAASLGIDGDKFKACLSAKTNDARVKKDFADGQLVGVSGTPSFYVNGKYLSGVPSYDDLKAVIDPLLTK